MASEGAGRVKQEVAARVKTDGSHCHSIKWSNRQGQCMAVCPGQTVLVATVVLLSFTLLTAKLGIHPDAVVG